MNVFRFFFVFSFLFVCGFSETQEIKAQNALKESLRWYNVSDLNIEGKGWTQTKQPFDRLPSKAANSVREPVWNLSQNSAGMSVRFITDSSSISVRWKLRSPNLALWHMPATGVSGVDLYVKAKNVWRWLAVGRADKSALNEQTLIGNMKSEKREYRLYLPLYNGVDSVEIGIPPGALFEIVPIDESKPIVFYGTSIVQGAVASRAGMAYPAILGRKLNTPIINLGFSGNGKMEEELAKLLTEIDAKVYVIDCLPNLNPPEVFERTAKFIEIVREKRPNTPILLVENIVYPDSLYEEKKRAAYLDKNKALRKAYQNLLSKKVENLFYVKSDDLLGTDGEATVDGIHPTDLGFMRIADALEPLLRRILKKRL